MKNKLFILVTCIICFVNNVYSQNNPRLEDQEYSRTIFYDDFNGNWRDKWLPSNKELFKTNNFPNILIWLDSIATIHQNSGNLYLTGLEYDSYSTKTWDGKTITADNISGQVRSKKRFLYGVFECNATFGYKPGSFPAFWLFYDTACVYDYGSEIDIVELKYENPNPGLDNNAFYYPCGTGDNFKVPGAFKDNSFIWSTGNPHTFKCVWSPSKTEFYVDNTKLHTITKTENNHYPDKTMDIRLSQQLYPYNNNMGNIDVPVTSTFHWVRAKEFFLAPEISCPPLICNTTISSMDVDNDATNITWSLSPSILFSGYTTGNGKNATITPAYGQSGLGTITYNFEMTSVTGNESFSSEESFWVGTPYINPNSIVFSNSETGDETLCANAFGNNFSFSFDHDYNYFNIKVTNLSETQTYCSFTNYGTSGDLDICSLSEGTYMFWVRGNNSCGTGNWSKTTVAFEDCMGFLLMMTPNPASAETTVSIEPKTSDLTFDENAEWSIEVFSDTQTLKAKKTRLKGKEHKIKTTGWKAGIYYVRAKYKDEVLQGKLVVKK